MLSTLPANPDPSEVPSLVKFYLANDGLPYEEDLRLAKVLGLVAIPAQTLTINTIRDLLGRYGPLWTHGEAHIVVIAGVNEKLGQVYVHDPWPVNVGRREWRSYTAWYIYGNTPSSVGAKAEYDVSFLYHP